MFFFFFGALGVPNTLNVITNFPFLVVGVVGLVLSLHGNYLGIRFVFCWDCWLFLLEILDFLFMMLGVFVFLVAVCVGRFGVGYFFTWGSLVPRLGLLIII